MTRQGRTARGPRRATLLVGSLAVSLLVPGLLQTSRASADDQVTPITTFLGIDGLVYRSAPIVVDGADGEMFYGPELDSACGVSGRLAEPMKAIGKLARILEESGRKVVFTLAPNKTGVLPTDLTSLPHGPCDQFGLNAQNDVMDKFRDPAYLPMRRPLMGQTRQMYWRTDLHWTTVGGAVYAKELASRLSPRLGRYQRFSYGTETRLGLLAQYLDLDSLVETLQTASPAGKVRVRNARGDTWSGYPELTFSNDWSSGPARRTWPGHTLLLGDSFMWYALENLRPIFRHGQFLWFVHTEEQKLLRGIRKADTVVIEVYQTVTPGTPIASSQFRHDVRQALRHRHGARASSLFDTRTAARGSLS